jgi:hypothetical protein
MPELQTCLDFAPMLKGMKKKVFCGSPNDTGRTMSYELLVGVRAGHSGLKKLRFRHRRMRAKATVDRQLMMLIGTTPTINLYTNSTMENKMPNFQFSSSQFCDLNFSPCLSPLPKTLKIPCQMSPFKIRRKTVRLNILAYRSEF